jgi:hypothetical protein
MLCKAPILAPLTGLLSTPPRHTGLQIPQRHAEHRRRQRVVRRVTEEVNRIGQQRARGTRRLLSTVRSTFSPGSAIPLTKRALMMWRVAFVGPGSSARRSWGEVLLGKWEGAKGLAQRVSCCRKRRCYREMGAALLCLRPTPSYRRRLRSPRRSHSWLRRWRGRRRRWRFRAAGPGASAAPGRASGRAACGGSSAGSACR